MSQPLLDAARARLDVLDALDDEDRFPQPTRRERNRVVAQLRREIAASPTEEQS